MRVRSKVLGAGLLLVVALVAPAAWAVGEDEAAGPPKGTIGGALLGAELVLLTEAAIDIGPTWAYIAGGAAGAIGGGIGGYFIEQSASARTSMLMLAGGLTLAIPTTVAVLSATAYEPPTDYVQDTVPPDEPVADPPEPETVPTDSPATGARSQRSLQAKKARVLRHSAQLRLTPPALLDIAPERIALAFPAVEVRDVYTPAELFVFGAKQATEVRVPVLSVAF
jgi:hypothetical protein